MAASGFLGLRASATGRVTPDAWARLAVDNAISSLAWATANLGKADMRVRAQKALDILTGKE